MSCLHTGRLAAEEKGDRQSAIAWHSAHFTPSSAAQRIYDTERTSVRLNFRLVRNRTVESDSTIWTLSFYWYTTTLLGHAFLARHSKSLKTGLFLECQKRVTVNFIKPSTTILNSFIKKSYHLEFLKLKNWLSINQIFQRFWEILLHVNKAVFYAYPWGGALSSLRHKLTHFVSLVAIRHRCM